MNRATVPCGALATAAVLVLAPAIPASAVPFNARRAALTNHLDHVAHDAAEVRATRPLERQIRGTRVLIMPRSGTLADIQRRFPDAVRQHRQGVWTVSESIVVTHGATLTISAPAVREVRLVDTHHSFTDIVGWGSNLRFVGDRGHPLLIRSWDASTRRVDAILDDGRGSVQARVGGRIDSDWTTFRALGFYAGRVSGVAVASQYGAPRGGGTLTHSTFVDNYFGAYSYNAQGMRFIGDRFQHNIIYGLDPHDNSDGFVVRDNYAVANGRHGIIFSRFCHGNLIVDNVSEFNGWHGIVLDNGKSDDGPSNDNVVAHNLLKGNHLVGISIKGSSGNLVSENVIVGGDQGIRVYGSAVGNRLERNTIRRPRSFGILLDHPSSNATVEANLVTGATDGIRVRDAPNSFVARNTIRAATQHGIKVDAFPAGQHAGVRVVGNAVTGAGPSPIGIQSRHVSGISVHDNPNGWAYPFAHRLARLLGWFVGPAAWVILFAAVILGGRIVALGESTLRAGRRSPGTVARRDDDPPRPVGHDQHAVVRTGPDRDRARPSRRREVKASAGVREAEASAGGAVRQDSRGGHLELRDAAVRAAAKADRREGVPATATGRLAVDNDQVRVSGALSQQDQL